MTEFHARLYQSFFSCICKGLSTIFFFNCDVIALGRVGSASEKLGRVGSASEELGRVRSASEELGRVGSASDESIVK